MTTTRFKAGPLKMRFSNLSAGAAAGLFVLFLVLAVAIWAAIAWILLTNAWIIYSHEATGWNFAFFFFALLAAIGAVTSKSED